MTRPRIAVVGLGGIAQAVHLPVIQRRRRDVDLVALAELSPSRLATIAERYGVPEAGRFAGVAELVDAV
ncbi:MAG TPA: Gfo/Idh/MocA family oxidoreductase, partial [Arachnia sp.]|nr:Gfo/Idh/MocA family oxidoreductase [Arachnia sp.]